MIKEVDLQSKCITAMRELGGFAQKTSNRFLIGVPDILCQLPGHATWFWEVKRTPSKWQRPDPTPKQKMWIRDYVKAGGCAGLIHFTFENNELMVGIKSVTFFNFTDLKAKWHIPLEDFVVLPRGCKMLPFKQELVRVLCT